jgi:hypothetical protein
MIVVWDIAQCSLEVDRCFRGVYCLHHQGLMMQAVHTSEMSDYFNKTTQRYIPDDFIFTLAAVRT